MGCAACSRDDGAQASPLRRFGVGKHIVGHAVGRHHFGLKRHAKVLQDKGGVLHGVPVGAGAHDHTDENRVHKE